jgi:hypothetical protein
VILGTLDAGEAARLFTFDRESWRAAFSPATSKAGLLSQKFDCRFRRPTKDLRTLVHPT